MAEETSKELKNWLVAGLTVFKYKFVKENGKEVKKPNFYNFFDTLHNTETKQYFGEDFGFCQRWRDMGGRIWVDPDICLNHIGRYTFTGDTEELNNIIKEK